MNEKNAAPGEWVRRFDTADRLLHGLLMMSFLGLSLTGLPLILHEKKYAATIASLLGGFRSTALIHRTFAVLMLLCFGFHLSRIFHRLFVKKEYSILWGPTSMVPGPKDVVQMVQNIRWFLGLGPRPRFDRFTYWEKFDYWAVFWGMGIIGGSGLMLWFPKLFARIVPGWAFNIALLIHGEEALLAVVFIFTVHFFNGHLRPEKFPMDTVIFTGVVPADEVRHERPAEWERMVANGDVARLAAPAPTRAFTVRARIVGTLAVGLGLLLVMLTIAGLVH
jgi:cytochrome b subunit of formate dehydrogenase